MSQLRFLLEKVDLLARWLSFVPPLISRLALGFGFYLTGSGKLAHLDNFTEFLTSLGVPFARQQAPFVAGLEYVGGICLLLGLLTRLMATALAGTMVVALMTADKASFIESWSPTSDKVPTEITSFAYLVLLLWLVVWGAGSLSLDRLLRRWFRKLIGQSDNPTDAVGG